MTDLQPELSWIEWLENYAAETQSVLARQLANQLRAQLDTTDAELDELEIGEGERTR